MPQALSFVLITMAYGRLLLIDKPHESGLDSTFKVLRTADDVEDLYASYFHLKHPPKLVIDARQLIRETRSDSDMGDKEDPLGSIMEDIILDTGPAVNRVRKPELIARALKFFEEYPGDIVLLVTEPVPATVVSRFTFIRCGTKVNMRVGPYDPVIKAMSVSQATKQNLIELFRD